MNEDNDLKRMFQAQRLVDEAFAPSFDEIEAKSRDFTRNASERNRATWLVPGTLSAIAVSVFVGLTIWINRPRPDIASSPQADLQELNSVCDSLLTKINDLNPNSEMKRNSQDQEMIWQTETDSLLPFQTLSFHVRTSQ